jgi:hypothetical protein
VAQLNPMRDLIVLIPGMLGSVLIKDGREMWGVSGQSVAANLLTFGKALKSLKLEQGIGHEDPKDGVSASRMLPRLYMIPTFWKVDGYGRLAERLSRRFTVMLAENDQQSNLIEFPYDWRLSNQLNGQRLYDAAIPRLETWRRRTRNPDAKLILICHSMGGLVARWFLDVLGGREITRTLITIGTPYQGSINALTAIVNGMFLGLGRIGVSVDELLRSFPSVYQLLPTYSCLDLGDGQLRKISDVDLPNSDVIDVEHGIAFHARVSSALEANPRYQTFAIKGVDQPTAQSVQLRGERVEPLRSYKGTDYGGDGTVPRPSSHPPEWPDEMSSVFAAQTHTMLQSTESILTQITGILTGHLGRFMGGAWIGLDVPDILEIGNALLITAISKDGDPSLPLHAICQSEDGRQYGEPVLMRPTGDGQYFANIGCLPKGAWRITVQSATPARQVEPVSDWVLVWDPDTL